jgi:hypothetical protein
MAVDVGAVIEGPVEWKNSAVAETYEFGGFRSIVGEKQLQIVR